MKPQGREGQGMSRKQCKNCVWVEAKHEYRRSQRAQTWKANERPGGQEP